MPLFYLDQERTKKLVVRPRLFWKNTEVLYNNVLLDTIPTKDDLRAGRVYEPEPGMQVRVSLLKQGFSSPEMIDVLVNGKPLPGAASDPDTGINAAFATMLVLGVINGIIGIISFFNSEGSFAGKEMGIGGLVVGALFCGLGFWLKKSKSAAPIIIAIVVIVADMILTVYFNIQSGTRQMPVMGVGLKVLFIVWLARGLKGVKAYHEQKASGLTN
jgi:hypothetical protein